MLRPRVGDTVIIEGIVSSIYQKDGSCLIQTSSSDSSFGPILMSSIKEIKSRPPQVGDNVWWDKNEDDAGATLIHIHKRDERKWGVVAYMGDIPQSVRYDNLRLTREKVS